MSIGCDVVDIARLQKVRERNGSAFDHDLFTAAELAWMTTPEQAAQCFAVKEACMKALGFGLGHGVLPTRFSVGDDFRVQPVRRASNEKDEQRKKVEFLVNTYIDGEYAFATVAAGVTTIVTADAAAVMPKPEEASA